MANQLNADANLQAYPNPPDIPDVHIITLSLLQEALSIDSEHCFWSKLASDYPAAFPDLPHLTNYNRRRKRLAPMTEQLARLWGRALRPDEDTFMVDSIPIPVAHIAREYSTRVCRKQFHTAPDKGYSASLDHYFIGYKLHVILTLDGVYHSMELTKGSVHDSQYLTEIKHSGLRGKPRENSGEVLYGAIEWSGNFRFDFEVDYQDNLRIIAGMNSYSSPYSLKPKETFTTPKFLYLLSHNGEGEASRKLHSWARDYKLVNGNGNRLTLLNNWEATYFDFNEKKLFELIRDTKKLGVDLFLLDDGWFGNKYPRNEDTAGLGDWEPNKSKLPNGIASLVRETEENNVKFGIWIKPEMVNPKSELYNEHPEWVIKQPERDEKYFRNQLVLDLSNPKVQDYVFNVVDELFTEEPDLAYIKWDANSVIYNAHSHYLKNQSHLYIKYVQGLYRVLKRLRAKYPDVPMMLCSGGGGRVDYGALQYFTEFWPSDNTDALERIFIQWEYSYFFPAISTANHVTEAGDYSLKYRIDVAMMGKLGFDIIVDDLSGKQLKFAQQAVNIYNKIKSIIWHGDQFRLIDPKTNDLASLMYMNQEKSEGIIFNYLVSGRWNEKSERPIKLKGLVPDKKYMVEEINMYPGTQSSIDGSKVYSGEYLMEVGFNPDINSLRKSVVLMIKEEKAK